MTTTVTNPPAEKLLKIDCRGRVRTPRPEREAILDAFEQSGLPGTKFAELHGLKYQTFATWVQKRRRERATADALNRPEAGAKPEAPASPPLGLAEVVLSGEHRLLDASRSGDGILRIELPGGARIMLGEPSQLELAAALLQTLDNSATTTTCPSC